MTASIKASESLAVPRPTSTLPSSMTESMLTEALDSDDIDAVKVQLVHVWLHYQSLEFALTDTAKVRAVIDHTKASEAIEVDVDDVDLVAALFRFGVLEAAYDYAHQALDLVHANAATAPSALRDVYGHLDHGGLAALLAQRLGE